MSEIDEILRDALNAGASDVHITVGIPPKMRVNGELVTMDKYPRIMPKDTEEIRDQIMNEEQRKAFEERGEYDMSFSIPNISRFRLNTYKQRGSVALAIRLVGLDIPSAESLGIPQSVMDLYDNKRGLVLVTGPTGSGKSTTLASIVDRINTNLNDHVITLEDPIEYLHRHNKSIIDQREIGLDSHSYVNALRAALREDPDVIMVGEMRDIETMSTALVAAETGHLVLSTLHTIGSANAVDRIIDFFPPEQQHQIRIQLAGVLEAIISQQLIPTADGHGRVAAFEVLKANPAVRNIIREGKTHQLVGIMQTSGGDMITMDDAIRQLYKQGLITKDAAIESAQDENTMRARIGGM